MSLLISCWPINVAQKQEVETEAIHSESRWFINGELTGKGQWPPNPKHRVNHKLCPLIAAAMAINC